MGDFKASIWVPSRRAFILRLLVESGGEINESIIYRAAQQGGFARDTRDDIRQDLDHLRTMGCLTEDWLDERLRVVAITERGDDAAHGKVAVAGVEQSRWRR